MIDKSAIFSENREYRYVLSRIWNRRNGYCLFCCLNPSTANENYEDPTSRRCIRFAESFGCGGMVMVNLFAYRSTLPGVLLTVSNPIGAPNDYHIQRMSKEAEVTIAAWGTHKAVGKRGEAVLLMLDHPHCLALTKNKQPQHPLYLKKTLRPKPFRKDLTGLL